MKFELVEVMRMKKHGTIGLTAFLSFFSIFCLISIFGFIFILAAPGLSVADQRKLIGPEKKSSFKDFTDAIADLKATPFRRFNDNFLWVWVNGNLVEAKKVRSPVPGKPLLVDVTGLLRSNSPNLITIRRNSGLEPGGGWRSVKLFAER